MPRKGPSTIQERLNRAKGQLNGVARMLEEGKEPKDVLIQLQAAISSLEKVKVEVIKKEVKQNVLKALDSSVDLLK
jgi:DNA-binding FrmR family transcriptional regulator